MNRKDEHYSAVCKIIYLQKS